MEPKWEQNERRPRYNTYLGIAAVKRNTINAGDTIPLDGVRVDVVASHGAVIAKPINGAAPPNSFCKATEPQAAQPDRELAIHRRAVPIAGSPFSMSAI